MTTIAYRDGIMAADTLCSGSSTRWGEVEKLRAAAGCIGGAAGPAPAVEAFCYWIENELVAGVLHAPYFTTEVEGSVDGLLVTPSGVIWNWCGKGRLFRLNAPFTAVGSGAQIAMGAMAMGASAEKAVEIASRFDVYTGGRITTLALEQPSRPKQEAK